MRIPEDFDALDRAILDAKAILREGGNHAPSTAEVEPYIPEALKRAFWERYIDKYLDQKLPHQARVEQVTYWRGGKP